MTEARSLEPVISRFIRRLNDAACLFLIAIAGGLLGCAPKAELHHPAETAIQAFLNRYFDTWSRRDMEGYGSCFDPQARILFVAKDGGIVSEGTVDFLHGQKLAHEQGGPPMTERPLEMKIQGDTKVAQAAVTWVLSRGSEEERGTDFFTLRHDAAGWRIVSLVFYAE